MKGISAEKQNGNIKSLSTAVVKTPCRWTSYVSTWQVSERNPAIYSHIRTTSSSSLICRPLNLTQDLHQIDKVKIEGTLPHGTTSNCDSNYVSPLKFFSKKKDSWRPCAGYRVHGFRTLPDLYPFRYIRKPIDIQHAKLPSHFSDMPTACHVFWRQVAQREALQPPQTDPQG